MKLAVLAVPTNISKIDDLREWLFPKSTGLKRAITIGEAIEAWGQGPHFVTFANHTLLFDDWWIAEGFLGHLQEPPTLQSLIFPTASLFLMLDGADGQCEHFDFARIVERRVIRRWAGKTSTSECFSLGTPLAEEHRVLVRLEAQLNKPGLQQFWRNYSQEIAVMNYPDTDDDDEMAAFLEEYFEAYDSVPIPSRSPEGSATLASIVRPLMLGLLSECLNVDVESFDFLSAPAYPLDGARR